MSTEYEPQLPYATPPNKWRWATPALVGLVLVAAVGCCAHFLMKWGAPAPIAQRQLVRIGLSLDNLRVQRWVDETNVMKQRALELGAALIVFSADGDDATQISQIENLISQDVQAIIVVPHNSAAVGPVLTKAQTVGIRVIAYDRLVASSTPDLYLSFDSVKVGRIVAQHVVDELARTAIEVPNIAFVGGSPFDNNGHQVHDGAMQVLEPLAKAGKIRLVYNEYTADWNPSIAYTNLKQLLDRGVVVDGVATAYDGLAYGAVQALAEKGLAGKVPVSGQDAELTAVQRLVVGTQTLTVWKPGRPLAEQAVGAAIDFANGRTPETNATVNNGSADIKSYLFDPVAVTKANIQDTLIRGGVYSDAEIYGTSTAPN